MTNHVSVWLLCQSKRHTLHQTVFFLLFGQVCSTKLITEGDLTRYGHVKNELVLVFGFFYHSVKAKLTTALREWIN